MKEPIHIKTIGEYHKLRGLPPPEHPLISVIDYAKMKSSHTDDERGLLFDFYLISIKRGVGGKMQYGQQSYDFDQGVMFFMAPKQLLKIQRAPNANATRTGWMLLIHPDFLWRTSLAKTIKQYEYFDYAVNEALFLSTKEEQTMNEIVRKIQTEYQSNIDRFSEQIIVAQIELLLSYGERFYHRQFITRKKSSHEILERLETLLTSYFNNDELLSKGLPTVEFISANLNVSAVYLRSLLKMLTGLNTQQHIHEKLIEKAKEKLSTTNLSVSEIAYQLGFEHPQSFSKFFKTKTSQSPLEFRQSFN
ncbi:helix-turn-helix domain-containing protein [Pseudochryseolinea flava]|uniref:AraC family transcriptional regulator n=1 Tax=Pseudochryseolinea flava TaxID=2059302 RepID=A0A364Y657_9BACT|nr:response regulator transcription factor [Pseudochryseolinea flava]RAW02566.1 AraC family transcriptional regulator [Pseudochryseolinea flava]